MKENKNFKLKSNCHCEEHSATRQSHEIASHSFAMTGCGESGRSMVEMLGVLAVIGVLSVAGVGGYTAAMKKHRANELLNEASKRAAIIAAQAMQGRENLSIGEFGTENARLNFDEMVPHDSTNTQFTLTITGVDEAVCQQMQKSIGPTIRKFEPATCSGDNNTVKLTYNDDMSATEKASDFNGNQSACGNAGKKYCTGSNTCVDTGASCTCLGTTPECQTCDTDTGNIVIDDEQEGTFCTKITNKDGRCNEGVCVTYIAGNEKTIHQYISRRVNDSCPTDFHWASKSEVEEMISSGSFPSNGDGVQYWLKTCARDDCQAAWRVRENGNILGGNGAGYSLYALCIPNIGS